METACFIPVSENHKCNAGQEFLLLMLVQRSLRQAKRSSCPDGDWHSQSIEHLGNGSCKSFLAHEVIMLGLVVAGSGF